MSENPFFPTAYQGAVAPEAFSVRVKQGRTTFDLSTATVAEIRIQKPNGETMIWTPASLANATAPVNGAGSYVDAVYVFSTDAGDLDQVGDYVFVAALTLPSGVVRTKPRILRVLGQYDANPC